MKVLIIIPAYNEEKSVKGVVDELLSYSYNYDYVIINDGSTDGTQKVCEKAGLNLISLPINLGIGGAVQTGYRYALENGYDIAVQLDGDGQHDPRYIPDLVDPICEGRADYVIGSRYIENEGFQSTRLRQAGIKLLSGVLYAFTKQRILDSTSGFRAVDKKLIGLFSRNYAQDYPEPEAIMQAALNGSRILERPVRMRERSAGKSSINRFGSVYYIIKVVMSIIFNRIIGKGEFSS